jgi:hypothetical protein
MRIIYLIGLFFNTWRLFQIRGISGGFEWTILPNSSLSRISLAFLGSGSVKFSLKLSLLVGIVEWASPLLRMTWVNSSRN